VAGSFDWLRTPPSNVEEGAGGAGVWALATASMPRVIAVSAQAFFIVVRVNFVTVQPS